MYTWNLKQYFHQGFVQYRHHFGFDNLLHHQGNAQEVVGSDGGKSFQDHFRGRNLRQDKQMSSTCNAIEKIKSKSKHMSHRQNQKRAQVFFTWYGICSKLQIRLQRAPGQHHAFWITCRPTGVTQYHQVVRILCLIVYVLFGKSIGIAFSEQSKRLVFHLVGKTRRCHGKKVVHINHVHRTLPFRPQVRQPVGGYHKLGITMLAQHLQLLFTIVR